MKKVFVLFAVATLSLGAISCDEKKQEESPEVANPATEENPAEAASTIEVPAEAPAENQPIEQESDQAKENQTEAPAQQ